MPENERQVDADAYHIWTPRPMLRSVYWKPDPEPPRESVGGAYEVFLDQRAFVAMHEHVWTALTERPFGWLIGDLCEDPSAGRRFIIVTGAIPSRFPLADTGPAEEAIVALKLEVERRRGVLVGWYLAHSRGDLRLSEAEVEEHERRFPEPWHVAFLFVTDPAAPRGACFRPTPDGFDGALPMPFHEMVTNESLLAKGVRRSRLDWGNLSTLDEVRAEPPPRPEAPAAREPPDGAGLGAQPAEAPQVDAPPPEAADEIAPPVPTTPVETGSVEQADAGAVVEREPGPREEVTAREPEPSLACPEPGPVPELADLEGAEAPESEEDVSPVAAAPPGGGTERRGPGLPTEPDPFASSRFDADADALGATRERRSEEAEGEPGTLEPGPEEFDAMVAELLESAPGEESPAVALPDLAGTASPEADREAPGEVAEQVADEIDRDGGAEGPGLDDEPEPMRAGGDEARASEPERPSPESTGGKPAEATPGTQEARPSAPVAVPTPRRRSRRGLAIAAVAAVILAVAVLGGRHLLGTRGTVDGSVAPAEPQVSETPGGDSGSEGPVPAESPAGEGEARPVDGAGGAGGQEAAGQQAPGAAAPAIDRVRLEAMSDRVLEAISRYYGRDVARERGEISCPELQAAFVEVMDSWIDYSTSGKQAWQGRLPEDLAERDERLYRGVQDVERLFGASGCPRP
jgi:hypothetical protein